MLFVDLYLIHFAAKEGFRKAFNDLAVMPPGSVEAIVMGPLFNFSMESDVILLALMPGQVNRFTDGICMEKRKIYYY